MTPSNTVPTLVQNEISAGIIVYRRTPSGVKFLLLYHGGGYWYFPKGHIEAQERSLQAAIRETAEEAGIKRADLKINERFKIYDKFTFFKGKTKIFKTVIFYLAETKIRYIRLSYEHDGFGWFTYKEAVKLLSKHKDKASLLKKANDVVIQKPVIPAVVENDKTPLSGVNNK